MTGFKILCGAESGQLTKYSIDVSRCTPWRDQLTTHAGDRGHNHKDYGDV